MVTDILRHPDPARPHGGMAPRGGRPVTDRYARQMVLPEVGSAGQARLAAARVLVVGAGGLGSPVLATLAGAGIGRLTVLDHDRVEESNLHRQPLYRMGDLGRLKAEAARDALLRGEPGHRGRGAARAPGRQGQRPTSWRRPTSCSTAPTA